MLVFYCCPTNYHKLSSLKQSPFITPHFCRLEVQTQQNWVICLESYKDEIKILVYLVLVQRETLGKNLLLSLFMLLSEFSFLFMFLSFLCVCGWRTEIPIFLLTVGWGSLSTPISHPQILLMSLLHLQSQQQRISLVSKTSRGSIFFSPGRAQSLLRVHLIKSTPDNLPILKSTDLRF